MAACSFRWLVYLFICCFWFDCFALLDSALCFALAHMCCCCCCCFYCYCHSAVALVRAFVACHRLPQQPQFYFNTCSNDCKKHACKHQLKWWKGIKAHTHIYEHRCMHLNVFLFLFSDFQSDFQFRNLSAHNCLYMHLQVYILLIFIPLFIGWHTFKLAPKCMLRWQWFSKYFYFYENVWQVARKL